MQQEATTQSLDTLEIPPDFTFATTRAVAVNLSVPAEMLEHSGVVAVEVKRPDDKVIYRGPLSGELALKLMVPTKDTTLDVVVRSPLEERQATIDIENDRVIANFEVQQ